MTPACPICAAPVDTASRRPWHPFCSQRCKLVDLDRWLTGTYRIPGPPADPQGEEHGTGADPAIRSEEDA